MNMSQFMKQSPYMKAAVSTMVLGLVTHIVSFASPYWLTHETGGNIGLWLNCVDTSCEGITSPPDWLRSAQALEVIGVATGLTALIVLLVTAFKQNYKQQQRKAPHVVMIVLSFLSAVFLQIAIAVIIKSNFTDGNASLSWALSVNILTVVLYGTTGIVLLIDVLHLVFHGESSKGTPTTKF
ncbi:hypothetical protein KP79_PYT16812 [Mizuhopecten yessoensis]|uniref:Uncharacterized protein n=1 Tax=Mizuhopecten yessoensis TaxID=6573 RepID=A0A210Q367_MIZYE|nr:hypothetical protein KP79_PYT16812 [Mizuhopecten yessoensis]